MIKKMIYLDESMGHVLRRIAHAQHKSISEVIREALRAFFKTKEVYDLVEYDRRMAEYLGNPSSATSFRDIMDK